MKIKTVKYILTVITVLWFAFMTFLSQENGESSRLLSGHITDKIEQSSNKHYLSDGNKTDELSTVHMLLRSAAHIAVFAVLAILLSLTVKLWKGKWYITAGFLAIWSFLDELLKLTANGRHCDFDDIFKNLLGSALGFMLVYGGISAVRLIKIHLLAEKQVF